MASTVGRVCLALFVNATSPYLSIVLSVRERLGTCRPDSAASSVMVFGFACWISRSSARLSSDKTAASVAIDGNHTVGHGFRMAVGLAASAARTPTIQGFMAACFVAKTNPLTVSVRHNYKPAFAKLL